MRPSSWNFAGGPAARTVATAILFQSLAVAGDPAKVTCVFVGAPEAPAASAAKARTTLAASRAPTLSTGRFLSLFIPMTPLVVDSARRRSGSESASRYSLSQSCDLSRYAIRRTVEDHA